MKLTQNESITTMFNKCYQVRKWSAMGGNNGVFREGGQERTFWGRDIKLGTGGRVKINRNVEGNRIVSWPLKKLEW